VQCTYYGTAFAGNGGDGYLCYVNPAKMKEAGVMAPEAGSGQAAGDETNKNGLLRGEPGLQGPPGKNGKDRTNDEKSGNMIMYVFAGNVVISLCFFSLARRQLDAEKDKDGGD
jgi:hypothetical protein